MKAAPPFNCTRAGTGMAEPLRHAFRIVMENATLFHDLAVDPDALFLLRGSETTRVPVESGSAYEAELEDFVASVETGQPTRLTPADSRLAVEIGLEALRQLRRSEPVK